MVAEAAGAVVEAADVAAVEEGGRLLRDSAMCRVINVITKLIGAITTETRSALYVSVVIAPSILRTYF